MTLNDFVAYIQFLTAFYISLGFEKLVEKIFFSDSYRRNVEILLDDIQKQLSITDIRIAELNQLLNDRITDSYHWIRRLSFGAFLFCLFLLLLAGLEPSFPKNDSVFFKNSWLGNAWLVVVAFASLPMVCIGCWALYRRFGKIRQLKKSLDKNSKILLHNVSCCLLGKEEDCEKEFIDIVLKSVKDGDKYDAQLIEKAKERYVQKIIEKLKNKI